MDNLDGIPYVRHQDNLGHEIADILEWMAFFLFLGWVIHRIITRHHYASAVIMLVSSVAAFLALISFDMTSDAAYVFWSLFAVAFLSLAKAIS